MVSVNDIAGWRNRIFSSLLSVVLLLGALAGALSIPLIIRLNLWPVALMDVVALSWIFALRRLERLPYTLRVLNFLAINYGVAIAFMLVVGPAGLNYLLGLPIMAVILLGIRSALLSLLLSAVTIVVLGANGIIALMVPGLEKDPLQAAFAVAINFSSVAAMVTLCCGTLLRGLSASLAKARTVADSLAAKQTELTGLNEELRLTSAAVARLNDMVLITGVESAAGDTVRPIIFVNDALLRRTGFARADILGCSMRMLYGPETDQAAVERILDALEAGQAVDTELKLYTKAGAACWVELEIVPFARDGEDASHWVVVARDITERRNAAEAIHRLAFYDVLTGLPNRRLLTERLEALVAQARQGRGLAAVLYVDLDNFKNINDARGHAVGDLLLCRAAARLAESIQDQDLVARIGGDEFVVLLGRLGANPERAVRAALAVAERVKRALGAPMEIDGQLYTSSASIGVALPLREDSSAHDLLREADTAMYHAKAAGRGTALLFNDAMHEQAQQKLALERDLARALDKGEFTVHLQLQVDHDGRPTGAEVLARWRRADGSYVPPEVFIPAAESSGLILRLGQWVLEEACRAWDLLDAAGYPLPLSVNVSPLQFRQPDFVERVAGILVRNQVPPQHLIFEVTEGLLVDETDHTIARMRALADLGIRFSVDDFGTGYSNLAYLKKMPLYELKIDKSFMRDTPHDANGTAIVHSILAMAGHLGLRVVAEGIETQEQARFLAANGRPCMQGYLYHRPMPLAQLIDCLAASVRG